MNETNEQQPIASTPAAPSAPVETPLSDLSLGDYRATREPKKPANEAKAAAPSPAAAAGETDEVEELEATATPEQHAERKKKLGGFQRTISKQNEEIAALKQRLGAQTPAAAAAPATPPAPPAAMPAAAPAEAFDKPKPVLADCATLEEFTEKLSDWKDEERTWRNERKATAAIEAAARTALVESWQTRQTSFKEQTEDYDAVLALVDDVMVSPAHQKLFLESDHGPALAYHLAQDPDELKRFVGLSPTNAAKEIGKLEALLFPVAPAESEEPEPKVSAAPRPFRPVTGNSARVSPDPAKLTSAEYRKARESGRIN
jgi:hypothetical protein